MTKIQLKEQAALYVLKELDSHEISAFEAELAQNEACQKWVQEYKSTIKQTESSYSIAVSEEQLQFQRMSLRKIINAENNKALDARGSHLDNIGMSDEERKPVIHKSISVKQPVWMAIAAIIIAFFLGKNMTQKNDAMDIIQLMNRGLLTHVDIQSNGNNAQPINLAIHASNEIEYSGNVKDDLIRNILFYLLLNDENPGKRLKVIKLLEQAQLKEKGRNVLISSMLSDANPGVRLKSARMLQSYKADNLLIDACVKSILEDENIAVRLSAMDILEAHPTPEMIPALQVIRLMDNHSFIQSRAESILADFEDLNNGKIEPEI